MGVLRPVVAGERRLKETERKCPDAERHLKVHSFAEILARVKDRAGSDDEYGRLPDWPTTTMARAVCRLDGVEWCL